MDESIALTAFAALAQPTRLTAFRKLIAAQPDGLAAGEIAAACKVPHNTMSTHLAALTRAGLITVERNGRVMTYRADLDGLRGLVGFLMRDCCGGNAAICAPVIEEFNAACRVPARA
jgi:DNA-binding transcriptional ArsR family regulator